MSDELDPRGLEAAKAKAMELFFDEKHCIMDDADAEANAADIIRAYLDATRSSGKADRIALAAIEAAGLVVVPREPTEEMMAAYQAEYRRGNFIGKTLGRRRWAAMLAAAPEVTP